MKKYLLTILLVGSADKVNAFYNLWFLEKELQKLPKFDPYGRNHRIK